MSARRRRKTKSKPQPTLLQAYDVRKQTEGDGFICQVSNRAKPQAVRFWPPEHLLKRQPAAHTKRSPGTQTKRPPGLSQEGFGCWKSVLWPDSGPKTWTTNAMENCCFLQWMRVFFLNLFWPCASHGAPALGLKT